MLIFSLYKNRNYKSQQVKNLKLLNTDLYEMADSRLMIFHVIAPILPVELADDFIAGQDVIEGRGVVFINGFGFAHHSEFGLE